MTSSGRGRGSRRRLRVGGHAGSSSLIRPKMPSHGLSCRVASRPWDARCWPRSCCRAGRGVCAWTRGRARRKAAHDRRAGRVECAPATARSLARARLPESDRTAPEAVLRLGAAEAVSGGPALAGARLGEPAAATDGGRPRQAGHGPDPREPAGADPVRRRRRPRSSATPRRRRSRAPESRPAPRWRVSSPCASGSTSHAGAGAPQLRGVKTSLWADATSAWETEASSAPVRFSQTGREAVHNSAASGSDSFLAPRCSAVLDWDGAGRGRVVNGLTAGLREPDRRAAGLRLPGARRVRPERALDAPQLRRPGTRVRGRTGRAG